MTDEEYAIWKARVGEGQPPAESTVTVKYHFKPDNPTDSKQRNEGL
jgi:hypothetical protein